MIRKIVTPFLCIAMMFSLGIQTSAAEASQLVVLKVDSPWCVVGNTVTYVDTEHRSVVPIIQNGKTLVPIRFILEAFGGTVEWDGNTKRITCTLENHYVVLTVNSGTALVNGEETLLEVPAQILNGRTLVPIRFVSEQLGLKVDYEPKHQLVVLSDEQLPEDLTTLPQVQTLIVKCNYDGTATSFTQNTYQTSSGAVTANVITVNLNDPHVRIKMSMVEDTLGKTASFSDIVASSGGAAAVINGNFFAAYDTVQDPVGTVMSDGTFLFVNSGITSVGFTAANEVLWGNPAIFVRIRAEDGTATQNWLAYTVNTPVQSADVSILYTPARGSFVSVNCAGHAMTVINDIVSYYYSVSPGDTMYVPPDGYVVYMGSGFTATNYFYTPIIGTKVAAEPYLRVDDTEGFLLNDVSEILSGAPRLVKDGEICTVLENGFTEARFTTAMTPRTAIGTTGDGRLLLVNVKSASIQQMRELMLFLGCENAVNLDGGASAAMYYEGSYIATPGRKLTTTLQIFVDS